MNNRGPIEADIHEIWDCYDDRNDYSGRSRRSRRGHDDDDDNDADLERLTLTGLIDSDIELRQGVDANGKPMPGLVGYVPSEEVCASKESLAAKPSQQKYEPYMGNYGSTLERWYHRAALVLWPRSRDSSSVRRLRRNGVSIRCCERWR